MSDPITAMAVGAAIGGGTSLARGKSFGSALQNAAIGGALGGGGSALGGLMGGAGAGAGTTAGTLGQGAGTGLIGGANLTGAGIASGAGTGATSGLGGFLSNIKGIETAPVNFGTGGYASGIGGQAVGNMGTLPGQSLDEILNLNIPKQNLANINSPEAVANSAFPKFQSSGLFEPSSFRNLDTGTSIGAPFSTEAFTSNPLMSQQIANNAGQVASTSFLDKLGLNNLSTMDKVNIGKTALDVGFPNQPQQMIQPETRPVIRGNPDMVSTPLYNVGPNVGMQEGNELGLPNLLSRMPLTEEELLRLQQQMQTTGFRGR
jgi:hypothetical protein